MRSPRIPAPWLSAAILALIVSLVAAPLVGAEGKKPTPTGGGNVTINGGTVSNSTTVNINADAGTAISDASGGNGNEAVVSGGDDGGIDVALAGNGGTATASANGGAVTVGDINSGGNSGNVITVGNTFGGAAPAPAPAKPVPVKPAAPAKAAPAKPGRMRAVSAPAPRAARVRAARLPSTGAGLVQGETNGQALFLLAGSVLSAGTAGLGLRRRLAARPLATRR